MAATTSLGVALAVAVALWQPAPVRILFIGNSLTEANGLPALVEALGRSHGRPVTTARVTAPDRSLEDHWNQGDARAALTRGTGWDLVVLQQGPSALPESRRLLVAYTRRFATAIAAVGARPALFMVWPARDRRGDFPGVSQSYRAAAEAVGGVLMPVGDAWRAAWRQDERLALYGTDGFHPSRLGSVLAAMVIFQAATGVVPETLPFAEVNERDAATLRAAAATVRTSR